MKKSLFILTALAAAATGAQAQSSVTLAGTVDVAVEHTRGSLTRRTSVVSGGNSTSKLIFRGVEDLGGGMYANFWLEAGILADSGLGQATNINNMASGTSTATAGTQGLTFLRRSIVGLGGRWGELQMGRNWNASYDTFTGKYDPFAISLGTGINYDASVNRDVLRVSNSIAYISPRFAGFGVNLYHFRGEQPSGVATSDDGNGSGIRLMYDQGPFSAVAHYVRQEFDAGDRTFKGAAAVYDFRFLKLAGVYNREDIAGVDSRGWLLGVSAPIGAGEIKAAYSTFRVEAAGSDPRGKKIAVGYVHNLSKRTALYTQYAHIRNSGGAAFSFAGATTAANASAKGFNIGVRHNF